MSPIIIDEENRIIYSPGLKRSAYMAQRLKDMKEKHECLSPTGLLRCSFSGWVTEIFHHFSALNTQTPLCRFVSASQMSESCSPTELKPSLGGTPTVFKLMCKTIMLHRNTLLCCFASWKDITTIKAKHLVLTESLSAFKWSGEQNWKWNLKMSKQQSVC